MLRAMFAPVLGHPFVYDRIRPLAVGGIDMRPSYDNLQVRPTDVILDLGCGTGDALRYLPVFGEYHGFDDDPRAVDSARQRTRAKRSVVHFYDRVCTKTDFERIRPTRVMMSGLIHHLSDAEALELLRCCRTQASVRRIATNDVVFLPRRPVNNLLARLDRGTYVRTPDGYRDLARRAGLCIADARVVRCHPTTGLAWYYLMALEPNGSPDSPVETAST